MLCRSSVFLVVAPTERVTFSEIDRVTQHVPSSRKEKIALLMGTESIEAGC